MHPLLVPILNPITLPSKTGKKIGQFFVLGQLPLLSSLRPNTPLSKKNLSKRSPLTQAFQLATAFLAGLGPRFNLLTQDRTNIDKKPIGHKKKPPEKKHTLNCFEVIAYKVLPVFLLFSGQISFCY